MCVLVIALLVMFNDAMQPKSRYCTGVQVLGYLLKLTMRTPLKVVRLHVCVYGSRGCVSHEVWPLQVHKAGFCRKY